MVARIEFVVGGGKTQSLQKKRGSKRNDKNFSNIPDLYWHWNDWHLDSSFYNKTDPRATVRTNKNSDAYSSRSDNRNTIANFWIINSEKRPAT